mmetsp:Transcript_14088/g.18308  ORF Transcript_14088/g.18308 Transcript_14088/m.18308 type:complete len:637 (+) Transcript_14088:68-1978(+)|eukprot:CAMPEP_0114348368 /NCGR_PEP_ID=MMETSP0101-20121206/14645_1 /TAXON_ID=38822 ORGANISM="Pteridomonas danica, Strain PT" /NCGR_SAMPLE_ID=MMETSP0101 /ASSEMBLY_ACC=CAM_ASM_000211 /LENGTH=636 /DNA_ID=CAMNT_0001486237 /DNA_START=20 /DNA_END=1930 /DNA_ORIENTATION=+
MEQDQITLSEDNNSLPFQEGVVVGIDLGTNTSCIAVWHLDKNKVKVIKNKHQQRTIPSIVRWDHDLSSPAIVGTDASLNPPSDSHIVSCTKRIIGLKWDSDDLQNVLPTLPFTTSEGPDNTTGLLVNNQWMSPIQVASEIVNVLKENSIEWFSRKNHRNFKQMSQLKKETKSQESNNRVNVSRCVIGVPVYFTECQKNATKQCALDAGFTHVTVMAESTAAALAYGLFIAGTKRVLVFDAGGGTTDVTLMLVNEGKFTTIACAGDNQLGGEDMDSLLAKHLIERHPKVLAEGTAGKEGGPLTLLRDRAFRSQCAACREALSTVEVASLVYKGNTMNVTRQELEQVLSPLIERAKALVQKVCLEGGGEVDEVVLVGGLSRTPALRSMLKALFPKLPDLCSSSDPSTTVAEGLAIRGAALGGVSSKVFQSFLMSDVLPLDIGVESFDSNDDEEGRMDVVLTRLTKLPATSTRIFRCGEGVQQRGITIDVFEGPHKMAKQNEKVASFSFPLPKIRKSLEQNHSLDNQKECREEEEERDVLVKFSMDESGEFRVMLIDDDFHDGNDVNDDDDGMTHNKRKEENGDNNELLLKGVIFLLVVIYLLFRLLVRPQLEYGDMINTSVTHQGVRHVTSHDVSKEL